MLGESCFFCWTAVHLGAASKVETSNIPGIAEVQLESRVKMVGFDSKKTIQITRLFVLHMWCVYRCKYMYICSVNMCAYIYIYILASL